MTVLVKENLLRPLVKFIADLNDLEFGVLKNSRKVVFVDYGIVMNPDYAGNEQF